MEWTWIILSFVAGNIVGVLAGFALAAMCAVGTGSDTKKQNFYPLGSESEYFWRQYLN
jgi:hypothetical protein